LITENPYKEVQTVEANKNREYAEMNISVNKVNIKEIEGIKLETGEVLVYHLGGKPQNKMITNDAYYVSESLDGFPDISTVNGKKYFSNFGKFSNKSIDNDSVKFQDYGTYVVADTANYEELYLGKLDKTNGNIESVSKINVKEYPIDEVYNGVLINNRKSLEIRFPINEKEELKKELKKELNEKFIHVYSANSKQQKRDLYKFEYKENIENKAGDFYENILKINSDEEITENLYLLVMDKKSNKILKKLEIKVGEITTRNSYGAYKQFFGFTNPEIVTLGGKKYIWFGNYLRVNRQSGTEGSVTEDGNSIYNFSFSGRASRTNFELTHVTGTGKRTFTGALENRNEVALIAGRKDPVPARDAYMYSGSKVEVQQYYSKTLETLLGEYSLTLPPTLGGEHYGWLLAIKILVPLDATVENLIFKQGFRHVRNTSPITVEMRHWNGGGPQNDDYTKHDILSINEIDQYFKFSAESQINLKNPILAPYFNGKDGVIELLGRVRIENDSTDK
ncbi:MAG: hypothetical protein ACRCVS_05535, partial [Fusobacteriaceae bacterium]